MSGNVMKGCNIISENCVKINVNNYKINIILKYM